MTTRHAKVSHHKKRAPVTVAPDGSAEPPIQPNAIHAATFIEPDQRRAMIAEAAYYRAERRDFTPGHEVEDWCAAESEIDAMLSPGETASSCD